MAKLKPAEKRNDAIQREPENPATFAFDRVNVTSLNFVERPRVPVPDGDDPPTGYDMNIQLGLRFGLSDNQQQARVEMTVKVEPDPRVKPYSIQLVLVGLFAMTHGGPDDLKNFCQRLAPAILFPYAREIIDRTTADGTYGSIRLDPMNMLAAIDQTKWQKS